MATQDFQRLIVTFEARLTKFERDMAKALGIANKTTNSIEKRFERMERKFAAVGRNIKAIFGGLGAAAVLRSFGQAIDKIANIGEIAGRIGITTKALQAMYRISKQTGASLEEMDRALQSFAEQSAEAGSFMQKLLVANDKPLSANVEENLRTVMDLLRDAANEQERLSIATKLFGDRLGRGLVEAFSKGGAELDRVFDELLAEGKAHSDAQIEEAKKIRDKYREYMDDIALYWQKTVVTMLESTGFFGAGSADQLQTQVDELNATLTTLLQQRDQTIMEGRSWFGKSIEQLSAEISLIEMKLRSVRALLKSATAPAASDTGAGTTIIPVTPVEPGEGREAIDTLDDAMKQLIADMDDARDAAKGFTSDLVSGLRQGLTFTESLSQAFSNLADKLIDKLIDQGIDQLLGPAGSAGTGLLGKFLGLPLYQKDKSQLTPEMPGPTAPIIPVMQKVLDSIAKPVGDGWKEVAREVLPPEVDLTAGAADAAGLGLGAAVPVVPVIQSLLKGIGRHPAYEQIAPSEMSPLDILELFKMFGRIGGGGLVGGARARGGPVSPGRAHLVGEEGPELFVPRSAGIISPNGGGAGVAGGMGIHVVPSKYFDVHVFRAAEGAGARALNTGRKRMPERMASFQKLGT